MNKKLSGMLCFVALLGANIPTATPAEPDA